MRYIFLLSLSIILSADIMYIELKSTPLKTNNTFLSSNILTLTYANEVNTIEQKGDWFKVITKGKTGWIHASALTKNKIIPNQQLSKAPTNVSSKEVTMAAKGFSAEVEKEYKKDNPSLNYNLIDQIEKSNISLKEQIEFVESGGLSR